MMPLALAGYMLFARHGTRFGDRILKRRLLAGKEDATRIEERKGIAKIARPEGELVWFHAASVGEALSIQELIRRLADEDESLNFLITTVTVTSAKAVEARLPDRTVHQFVPLDFTQFIDRFLDHWKPDLAVWTESEIWPALLTRTAFKKIPMILLNARMSAKSFRRWRFLRRTARRLMSLFREIHVQDDATAGYLEALGVPRGKTKVTGTLKEGSSALPHDEALRVAFAEDIGRRTTWLAASTHPGEEEMAARAHREVLRRAPRTLLIVVPRHPERGSEIVTEFRDHGWRTAQRSAGEPLLPDTEIYVADTLGELGLWYRIAPISFVGGSLVPIGGHNPFEPAALGSAIISGTHVVNFRDIYDRLKEAGACRMVESTEDLAKEVTMLLAPDQVALMAHAAWEVCSSGAEVTDQALDLVFDSIGQPC